MIALNPDTGKLKWHYQFTPNDSHDCDSTEDMILVGRIWHGVNRKMLLHADPNGIFYVLDRNTGNFLAGNPHHDGGQLYTSGPEAFEPGKQYGGRGAGAARTPPPGEARPTDGIQAFDPETGKTQWKFVLSQGGLAPGGLATGGGIVFAATSEGNFLALDAKTGKALWHFTTGSAISSSPMSYSVGGKQYVAVTSAGVLYSFGLPE